MWITFRNVNIENNNFDTITLVFLLSYRGFKSFFIDNRKRNRYISQYQTIEGQFIMEISIKKTNMKIELV